MNSPHLHAPTRAAPAPYLRYLRLAANLAIWIAWLWLYRPVFSYLGFIFSEDDFRTNQIVLLAVLVLIFLRLRQSRLEGLAHLDAPPQLYPPALALVLGGSIAYLLVERFLDINTLSASLFGLATYGLLGLWLPARNWRSGLPALLLLVSALPFADHLQTFVGFPMRLLTASMISEGLSAVGIASVSRETILVFETGISQVDLPCSGVKSLWAGAIFLLAALWIEERPLNLQTLLVAAAFSLLLFAANVGRVAALVIAGPVLGLDLLAEMLHVPLGVINFTAACLAALALLRWASPQPERVEPPKPMSFPRPVWLAPALAAFLSIMAMVYQPRPQSVVIRASPVWYFPEALHTTPQPLSPKENEWLASEGTEFVERRRFQWGDLKGSMILITSASWRAHHNPERCFEVYGLKPDESVTLLVAPQYPARALSLGDGKRRGLFSAAYWFQSLDQTTDDYGARMWADLSPQRQRWVLVTVLFDRSLDLRTEQVQAFFLALHGGVQRSLEGGFSQ
jgi:exosortase O